MPHADEAQLHAYLDREAEYADPDARKALGRHIADCSTCSALLKEVRQIHSSSTKLLEVARPRRRAMPSFDDVVRRANELRATASPPSNVRTPHVEPEIEDIPTIDPAESIASQPITWIEPDERYEDTDEPEADDYVEISDEASSPAEFLYEPEVEQPESYAPAVEEQVSSTEDADSDVEFIEMSSPAETEASDVDEAEQAADVVDGFESFNDTNTSEEVEEIVDAEPQREAAETPAEPAQEATEPVEEEPVVHDSWDWLRRGTDDHLAVIQPPEPGEEKETDSDINGLRISRDVGLEQDWMAGWTPASPPVDEASDEMPDENEGAIDAPDLTFNHSLAAAQTDEHEIEVPIAPIPPVAPPPTAAQRRSSSAHRAPRRVKRKRGTRVLALAATVVIAAGIGVWYGRPYIYEQFGVNLGGFTDADTPTEPIAAVAAGDEKSTGDAARALADSRRDGPAEEDTPAAGRAASAARAQNAAAEPEVQASRQTAERDRPAQPAAAPPANALAPSTPQSLATVTGVVRDAETNRPVPQAQVVVEGTGLATTTDLDGRYRLAQVPIGQSRIRARAIGFGTDTAVVALTGNRESAVDLTLPRSVVSLDEIVVAGAREERAATSIGLSRREASDILGGPLVLVPELSVVRIEESPAGGVRVTQRLENGGTLMLDIRAPGGGYTPGARIENFRVMPSTGDEAIASARFGSYLITARANVSADALSALMRRLAESPDSD